MEAVACGAVLNADLEVGVSTVMLRTSSSASLRRPCLTGLVTTTYLHTQHDLSDLQWLLKRAPINRLMFTSTGSSCCGHQNHEYSCSRGKAKRRSTSCGMPPQRCRQQTEAHVTAHPSWRPFCARTRSSDSASGGCAEVLETLLKESNGSDSSSKGLPAHASTPPIGRCRASATRRSTPCRPLLCSTAVLANSAMSLGQQCTLRIEQGCRRPVACGKVGQRDWWAWLHQPAPACTGMPCSIPGPAMPSWSRGRGALSSSSSCWPGQPIKITRLASSLSPCMYWLRCHCLHNGDVSNLGPAFHHRSGTCTCNIITYSMQLHT